MESRCRLNEAYEGYEGDEVHVQKVKVNCENVQSEYVQYSNRVAQKFCRILRSNFEHSFDLWTIIGQQGVLPL